MPARPSGLRRPTLTLAVVLAAVLAVALAAVTGGQADVSARPDRHDRPAALATSADPVPNAPMVPSERAGTPEPARTADPARASEPARTSGASMAASAPTRLQIPAIGVDSELMALGLATDRTLQVPPSGFPAGWYTGAPTPGQLGPAIIAGHVDWGGQPGVFYDLRKLTAGDAIAVTRQDGSTAQFRVERVERFAKDEFPTELVYADLDHAGLRLITCGGDFDPQARSYKDNVVVFARLADSDHAS